MASDYFGGIEAGGTKFNCIVATGPDDVLHHARIPTHVPARDARAGDRLLPVVRGVVEGSRHRLVWAGGSRPALADLRLHHQHAEAGLAQHRFRRRDPPRAERAGGV